MNNTDNKSPEKYLVLILAEFLLTFILTNLLSKPISQIGRSKASFQRLFDKTV